jgi:ABC-type sugar transport system substrate-binding protein
MKFTSLRAAAVLAALGAAAFAGGVQPAPVPRSQQRQEVRKRVLFAPAALGRSTRAGRGPGWTHAQVKRMAKKRRNVLRNRCAHRGRG